MAAFSNYSAGTLDISALTALALGGIESTSYGVTQNLVLTNGSNNAINLTLSPGSGQTPNFYGAISGKGSVTIGGTGTQILSQTLTYGMGMQRQCKGYDY